MKVLKLTQLKRNREKITQATNKQKDMWRIVKKIENKEVNDKNDVLQTLELETYNGSKWEKANKIRKFSIDMGKNDTSNITEAEIFCSTLYNHKTVYVPDDSQGTQYDSSKKF